MDCTTNIQRQRLQNEYSTTEIPQQRLHDGDCTTKIAQRSLHDKDYIETLFGVHAQFFLSSLSHTFKNHRHGKAILSDGISQTGKD